MTGLDGTVSGSCVVCFTGTDTGLAFVGPPEWAVAGLVHLGVEDDAAPKMVTDITGSDPGMVPDRDDLTIPVRVCQDCAEQAGMKVGLIATGVPGYRPTG